MHVDFPLVKASDSWMIGRTNSNCNLWLLSNKLHFRGLVKAFIITAMCLKLILIICTVVLSVFCINDERQIGDDAVTVAIVKLSLD